MTKVLAALVAALAATAQASGTTASELQNEFDRLTAEFQRELQQNAASISAEYAQKWADLAQQYGLDSHNRINNNNINNNNEGNDAAVERAVPDRRNLNDVDFSDYAGLLISRDKAKVTFGSDEDVHIARTGDGQLSVVADSALFGGDVSVEDSLLVQGVDVLKELRDTLSALCPTRKIDACSNSTAPAMENCCDDGSWQTVLSLDIPDAANYDSSDDVSYSVNNADDFEEGSFKRIGYHLQLDDEWVFVSMNAFTTDPSLVGIPVDWDHDSEAVTGLSILSNSPALVNQTGMVQGEGSIEFWSNCYGTGNGVYDHDDDISTEDCYGSFQVHTSDGTTIFAYNAWSHTSRDSDVGLGNQVGGTGHTDWTFAENAGDFSLKRLTVLLSDTAGTWIPSVELVDDLVDAQMDTQLVLQDLVEAPECPVSMEEACSNSSNTFQMENCCHGGGWKLVYDLDIEDSANYDTTGDVPYTTDNAASVGSFRRVGYHLQLDDEWVFVSMMAYTTDAGLIGMPVDWDHQLEAITGLTISSNAASLENVTGLSYGTGSIEFWSNCYGRGALDLYDNSDVISTDDCYGSFQVHTEDGGTIFAYNGWSHSSNNDLGIGSHGGDHPDWTFADNAATYDVKNLKVFINEDPGSYIPRVDDLEGPAFCKPANELQESCQNAVDYFSMLNCCDGGGWELAYQWDVEDSANYDANSDVPYSIDRSGQFADGSFRKIAYHLQLDDEFVFVSMNSFTTDPELTGLPVDYDHDYDIVHGVNVVSNADTLFNITGMTDEDGVMEMWSNCYGTGGDGLYSGDDTISSNNDCYGSFQVHLSDGTTVFAYNGWSHSSYDDLGIGNQPVGHPDWTFANNADTYTKKTFSVFLLRY